MMMWSNSGIPRITAALARRFVVAMSSSDGDGFPLGWLWLTMIAEACSFIAAKISYRRFMQSNTGVTAR